MYSAVRKHSQPARRGSSGSPTSKTTVPATKHQSADQAIARRAQNGAYEIDARSSTAPPRFTYDFSQISIDARSSASAAEIQTPGLRPPSPVVPHAGGQPLPEATRRNMRRVLGWDFSSVHTHADRAAAEFTNRVDARAVTVGSELFFNDGEFRPGTTEGEKLIGHELAHVVQQAGGDRNPGGPADPERAAEAAGNAAARGAAIQFGLRAAPAGVPALQPKPGSPPKSWDERLTDAQAEPDLAKRSTAMTALVGEALGSGYTVHEAGTKSTVSVDTADYAASPQINFDVRLNQKTKRDGKTPVPATDAGWTLNVTTGKTTTSYPILGPLSLVVGQPVKVKLYADHELYHASHPSAGELEAWTDTFTHYFLATYLQREAWSPLVKYYEEVLPDPKGNYPARQAAVTAISTFYKGLSTAPGTDASKRSEKERFETWLIRRLRDTSTQNKALIKDLSSALGITVPTKAAPATTAP